MGNRLPVLIALVVGLLACGGAPAAAPSGSALPAPLPGVSLATLAGDHVEVARVANGRVALVSLWATWCEACEKEMDALNRLDAKTGSDAVVIGVAVGEERAKVAEFARRRGLRYVQLVDQDFSFADAIGQRHLPATLVVDRQGRIVFRGEAINVDSLAALRRAIAGAD
ncbi:MAG: TlpA family protein disulfide reductase [Polyangiaceae bacterium]